MEEYTMTLTSIEVDELRRISKLKEKSDSSWVNFSIIHNISKAFIRENPELFEPEIGSWVTWATRDYRAEYLGVYAGDPLVRTVGGVIQGVYSKFEDASDDSMWNEDGTRSKYDGY